jgi:hypothetical protein
MREVKVTIQGVSFNAAESDVNSFVNFWSKEHNLHFAGKIPSTATLKDFLEELIKRSPIEEKSTIKTNVYLKNTLEDCDGDAFDKLVNVVVSKLEFDGFFDIFAREDSKSYIIPFDNIELIENIYIPIFKDL